jgi:hypothetical protein
MMNMIDVANLISSLNPGESIFSLLDGKTPQVVFLVRERSAVIKSFGETSVEACSGLFSVGEVAVTAVIFRVGKYVRQEYLTWWDYYQPGCADIFRAMVGQDSLSFHFYGDNGRRDRFFVEANTLGDFFAAAIDTISRLPAWTRDDFLSARRKIHSLLPTPKAIWDAAHQTGGKQ